MVEVFKTNVQETEQAGQIILKLLEFFPSFKINFDLSDCDKILRVEGNNICAEEIIELVNANGFETEVLI
jgi:hypothetical protein